MTHLKVTYKMIQFESLSPSILYDTLALREEVFNMEQQCNVADLDSLDKHAIHAIGQCGDIVCAVVRILPPDVYKSNVVSFGRFAVKKKYRRKKLGYQLMDKVMNYINTHHPNLPIEISAQLYLKKFYTRFGFKTIGQPYDEGGISHVKMMAAPHTSE